MKNPICSLLARASSSRSVSSVPSDDTHDSTIHSDDTSLPTTDTPFSSISPDDSSDPDLDEQPHPTRIYHDAALYGQVLRDATPTASTDDTKDIKGFDDLVAHDLDEPSQTKAGRLAQFAVNDWAGAEYITEEPEEMDSSPDTSSVTSDEQPITAEAEEPDVHVPETPLDSQALVDDSAQLQPAAVVELLVREFGPLAVGDEKEEFVVESDAAIFKDVAILGVLHLTSHRMTFHASLLSARPDILQDRQIIKSGPVIIHRPGFRKKRRLWLELSHDMLTSYPSSKFEDRIRPIKSILLANIEGLRDEDPENPRVLRMQIRNHQGLRLGYAEFGTEEAAREWRKELTGALFLYRHRRVAALGREADDDSNGVRISVPLHCIRSVSLRQYLNFCNIMSIEMHDDTLFADAAAPSDTEKPWVAAENYLPSGRRCRDRVEVALMQPGEVYEHLPALIEKDTARFRQRKDNENRDRIYVDFGSLSFLETALDPLKVEDEKDAAIRRALSLKLDTSLWYARARFSRAVCASGYFAVTSNYVGFWSKMVGFPDARYRLPVSLIKQVVKIPGRRFSRTWTMVLEFQGYDNMTIDFWSEVLRDEAISKVTAVVDKARLIVRNASPTRDTSPTFAGRFSDSPPSSPPVHTAGDISPFSAAEVLSPLSRTLTRAKSRTIPLGSVGLLPKVINVPQGLLHRIPQMHFVCLTIGSRGDVQPYIALGLGLKKHGHRVTIVTHEEYKSWVEHFGIAHRTAGGDPGMLMKLSVEHKMFSPQFFKESLHNFRGWLDELLVDAWEQCRDADVLLESPSAMAGVHIAEALSIPYFRTFTMPWTKTAEFPHSFLSPPVDSASFNIYSYILFDNVFWTATSGQINRWRRNTLKLPNTDMGHKAQQKIPFIYNFSTAVVPRPLDWGDEITISGYWFLDNPEKNWTPPESLTNWMTKARQDKKPIVYIGFGSITVPNPPAMTRHIIKAVLKSGVRAIISKGWSSRMSKEIEPEVDFPPECYPLDKVPHDWLFPQIDAALHHGGAGTTGASLRAGIPTLIKPWFGDQYFWASRVHALGAGIKISSMRSAELAAALTRATTDTIMKERAAETGQRIREENGVEEAITAISTYLPRAVRSH